MTPCSLSIPLLMHSAVFCVHLQQHVTQLRLLKQAPPRPCRACTTPLPASCTQEQSSLPAATRRAPMPSSPNPGRACTPLSCASSTITHGECLAIPADYGKELQRLMCLQAVHKQWHTSCYRPASCAISHARGTPFSHAQPAASITCLGLGQHANMSAWLHAYRCQ